MTRHYRLYLVGFAALVTLAGCGRGFISFEERPQWRHEAEAACLKSGAVKITPAVAQVDPINGPGMCGADFPLKVAALGQTDGAMGYADDPRRPPGGIPQAAQPRWPVAATPQNVAPSRYAPQVLQAPGAGSAGQPMMIAPAGASGAPTYGAVAPPSSRPAYAPAVTPVGASAGSPLGAPMGQHPDMDDKDDIPDDAELPRQRMAPPATRPAYHSPAPSRVPQIPQLGPPRGLYTGAVGPAVVTPAATLACPIVSALDQWVAGAVQPAAQRWFGQPVVEIKQISAYSCRGMNGQPGARISEHAFGNALDIAAFVLADGRRITVKRNWNGAPEEQGFLRDVQGAACQTFSTVLAPGSNRYHYDHIHVDLMRRASGRRICQPGAVDGQIAAARAANKLAGRADPAVTGSIGKLIDKTVPKFAIPGEDDVFDDDEAETPPSRSAMKRPGIRR